MTAYKAVFSDIDGTLLNSKHVISPDTLQAVRRIIRAGIPFIPVSARPPYAITAYTDQLDSQQAIICYSGALILDKNLTALYSVTLSGTDLQRLDKLLGEFNHLSVNHYSGTHWFSNDLNNPWCLQESEITKLKAAAKPADLIDVHKILVMGPAQDIRKLEILLKQNLPHLSIHRSKNEYLEIMNKAATKAKAIDFILHSLNISADEIIAFGDNFNDADMLQYAGHSVAMGNAPEEIKNMATEITATNDEDGIAQVLNRIFV
ncbi:Cof subfamily protein (haloacid dehalogenase superfamily)/HAD superfamily hydrolase (TIGR01484 family) [Mesocricetibacter intestinalis]|uniref:Cof subfamily protein (Haloacid dehalogenase superfamily)/HAD superfamily hydrolase (TIGR01484 family) n=1 Tax=Mesocricetibacter intestinalis TaxID=1521930 RepID=A0A4R6V8K9_9PAST|nr:Cof-type HAD-IIB family hydrolase [Mesocricetibacter intestinalis]TDQ57704.1 Cof subfamily protein (haloacid dehalogenase superfamily)/HAD superfamily hydrolase (TIGR01484 family) [Mesocricetibacter intestinalis]